MATISQLLMIQIADSLTKITDKSKYFSLPPFNSYKPGKGTNSQC